MRLRAKLLCTNGDNTEILLWRFIEFSVFVDNADNVAVVTFLTWNKEEAQLPQRNSASAAHMEGAKPTSPLPLSPLAIPICVRSNPKPATNVRQACRP